MSKSIQSLSISTQNFRRLEPYLPKGLVANGSASSLDRAAGQLARMVLTQQLRPGEKISLDDIAASIGVSRTPVREALRLLETNGFVRALPNRGFIVGRLDPLETQQLYEARRCLESYVVKIAFPRRDRSFLKELRALHRIYARVLQSSADRRRLGMLVDKAFHVRIAQQAGNSHLSQLLSNIFDRLILTRPIDGFPLDQRSAGLQEHARILAAFEGNDAPAAVDAVVRNIDRGGAAIIEHLRKLEEFDVPNLAKESTQPVELDKP